MTTINAGQLARLKPDIIPVSARYKPAKGGTPVCQPSCVLINLTDMPPANYHLTLNINGEPRLLQNPQINMPEGGTCRNALVFILYLAGLYHVNGNSGNTYFKIGTTHICGVDPAAYGAFGTAQPMQFEFVETVQQVENSVDALNLIFGGPVSFHGCGFYYNQGY
jgi:hypothetical protein